MTALVSALLAYLGWKQISGITMLKIAPTFSKKANSRHVGESYVGVRASTNPVSNWKLTRLTGVVISAILVSATLFLITNSIEISAAISSISTIAPILIAKARAEKRRKAEEKAWPEAIDHIISALHSGQSITESLIGLRLHGPDELKACFNRISARIHQHETLDIALEEEMKRLESPTADAVFTALIYAKEFGGRDVANTLRLLSSFLRDDAQMRDEIDTRFGWVRNSAFLGAAAPWLLLALLSLQRTTREAYSTPIGRLVLVFAVVATAAAFLWMERIAKLPSPARPFKPKHSDPTPFEVTSERSRDSINGISISENKASSREQTLSLVGEKF